MKIDSLKISKNPVLLAGFILLLTALTACQTPTQPDQVTLVFWRALLRNDLDQVRQLVTQDSQPLVKPLEPEVKDFSISIGKIIIEKPRARVETFLKREKTTQQFTTYLLFENSRWKVDYARTIRSFSGDVFENLVRSLDKLGEQLNQQIEKEVIPQLQDQIESFGEQLKQQLDEFNRNLNKFLQPPTQQSVPLQPGQQQI